MLKNTYENYGLVARALHWLMALLMIGMCGVGYWMMRMEPTDAKWGIYGIHKAIGLIVLTLAIIRLVWRVMNVAPKLGNHIPAWQRLAAKLMFVTLYAMMIGMPITGVAMSFYGGYPIDFFGLFQISPAVIKSEAISNAAHTAHSWGLWIILAAVGLHIAAGFYHHFMLKDTVLKRIFVNS